MMDDILRVIIVHMHYDTRSSMGLERASALVRALLRPGAEHTWWGYSMGMGMHSIAIIICIIVIVIAWRGSVAARALLLMVVHGLG